MTNTITKTFAPANGPVQDAWLNRHTGYIVENEFGAIVATVDEAKRGGYTVRLYTSPDEYTIARVSSILDARDIAVEHAEQM